MDTMEISQSRLQAILEIQSCTTALLPSFVFESMYTQTPFSCLLDTTKQTKEKHIGSASSCSQKVHVRVWCLSTMEH